MNLDYFVDNIVKNKRPLDLEKIFNSDTIFKIFLAEPHTGFTHAINNKEDVDLYKVLKATCSFPGCYYPLVKINGKKYLDGNSVKVFPIEQAIHDGCTDILIVATVTEEHRERRNSGIAYSILSNTLLFPLGKRFKERYKMRTKEYNDELDLVFGRKEIRGVNIYTISPDYMIKNSETNPEKLKKFAEHGLQKAKTVFKIKSARKSV